MENLDENRLLLNQYPSPGIQVTKDKAITYYIEKRYLTVKETATRMVEINKMLGNDFKDNTVEKWIEELEGIAERLRKNSDYYKHELIQTGIFKFFLDTKFKGCIRVFADIGTLMDEKLKV